MHLPSPFTHASRRDVFYIVVGMIFSGLAGAMMPLFMSFFGDLIDSMNFVGGKRSVNFYAILEVLLGVAAFVACTIGTGFCCMAGEHQIKVMNSKYNKSILNQEMAWFDTQESGRLAARASEGVGSMRDGLGVKLAQFSFSIVFCVAGYIIALFKNWKIALVISSLLPVNVCTFVAFFLNLQGSDKVQRATYENAAGALEEALLALRTVVSFGLESRFVKLFSDRLKAENRRIVFSCLLLGFTSAAVFGMFYFSEALGFWYGAHLISGDLDKFGPAACISGARKCVTGGEVLSVFFTIIMSIFSIGQCAPCLGALASARSAVNSFNEVINRKSQIEPDDPTQPKFGDRIEGRVDFRNITFRYPSRQDNVVYSNLNLSIPAGKSVALVGASGCGKSTIVQLLQRYYDIESGAIEVDGKNIQEHNLTSLRRHMALVSQEPRLFATSILENIRAGRLEATDEECEMAAKQANAHNFIKEFPQGYKTYVGEGGGQLSGGQKQRIAIARAILRNPAILILDEATSALDNESEKVVQDALDKLLQSQKRTTIMIAHRLSTIRQADMIVVFEKINEVEGSKIAEIGSHAELLAAGGIYAKLVEAQSLQVVQDAADIAETFTDIPKRAASLAEMVRNYSKETSLIESHNNSRRISRVLSKDGAAGGGCFGGKAASEPAPYKVTAWRKFGLLKMYPWLTATSIVAAILDGTVLPCYVILFASFNNAFFGLDAEKMRSDARIMAMWLCIIAILTLIITTTRLGTMLMNSARIAEKLRIRLFEHVLHQEIAFFDNPLKGGGAYISDVIAADPKVLASAVSNNTVIGFVGVSAVIVALIIAFQASPKLAGVALGAFFLMAPGSMLESQVTVSGQSFNAEDFERGKVDVDTTAYVLLESMQNLKTVQAYSLQKKMCSRYDALLQKEYRVGMKTGWIAGGAWGFSQLLQFCSQALIFWYGAKLTSQGEIDTAAMFRGSLSLMMAAMTFGLGAFFAGDNAAANKAASRIFEILDRQSRVDPRDPTGDQIQNLDRQIEFKNVVFRYPMRPDNTVYNNLSFTVKKGETVALVGASGCGKSTAVQLLEKFYLLDCDSYFDAAGKPVPPGSGHITVDDKELASVNTKSWRKCIGMVQQEPLLFTTTVRENIELGKYGEQVSQREIEEAAKMANASEFISAFENGYDTFVGTRGGQLSGGQKQRVAIARALIRNPPILILDEATSALDAESEKVVQAALDDVIEKGNRTTIVIAHRLSTVRKADKIVVLKNEGDGSQVVEVGTHEELMRNPDGVYKHLAELAMESH